jgi:hypothetical protein
LFSWKVPGNCNQATHLRALYQSGICRLWMYKTPDGAAVTGVQGTIRA